MDLNAPLGMGPPPASRRPLILAASAGLALIVGAGAAYLLVTADPHGGEPYAVAALAPPRKAAQSAAKDDAVTDAAATGSLTRRNLANDAPVSGTGAGAAVPFDEGTFENGVRVHRGTEPVATHAPRGPLVIDVTRQLDATPQKTKTGGHSTAFSPPSAAGVATAPRIAIYVSGMGLSKTTTRTAIEMMPPAVTLAFVPYGETVSALVDAARGKGHEILLQLPMQSGSGSAQGPHALRPNEPADALGGDLDWLTSRFAGFDGVTNLLGAPVTADTSTMTAVLKAIGSRNLFFVDDGTSKRSVVPSLAAQLNIPATQVDVVLDATADPAVVKANMVSLVAVARRKGQAIGMASGLPEHLSAIARFASDLASKNVTLVPVNAIARRDASIAANGR